MVVPQQKSEAGYQVLKFWIKNRKVYLLGDLDNRKMLNSTDMFHNNATLTSEFTNNSNVTSDKMCAAFDIENQYLKKNITSDTRLMIIVSRLGILSVVILIGLIGNTLAFLVMWKDKAGRDGNWMLRAVAINDNLFLVAMFCCEVLLQAFSHTPAFSDLRHWYPHIFPFFYYSGEVTLTTAQYALVIATIERYIAVCRPHRNIILKKHTRRAMIALPIIAVIIKLPQMFEFRKVEKEVVCGESYADIVARDWVKDFKEFDVSETVSYGILHTLLPIVILVFCNVNIIMAVRASTKMQSTNHVASERRPTRMLVTVVIAFIVCNLPAHVVWTSAILSEKARRQFWIFALWVFLSLLQVTNSAINSFLYCFVVKKFRRKLLNLLCCKTKESNNST